MIDLPTALLRLAIAVLLGAIIGVEREWRHKTAGIKTNCLVALGAAGFAIVSNTFGPTNHNPGQIAAAVVSGIGFIGAGVIIHRGATVQGVTTAATLWANASMGLASGLGQYAVAGTLFVGMIFVQFTMRQAGIIMKRFRADEPAHFEVRIECLRTVLREVNETCKRYAGTARLTQVRRVVRGSDETVSVRTQFRTSDSAAIDVSVLEEELVGLEGVRSVELRHIGSDEE